MCLSNGVLKTAYSETNHGWLKARFWLQTVSTKQMIAEMAIVSATLAVIGVVLFFLVRAMQHCTISGPWPC